MIDPELKSIITPELAEGEELLWAGRPEKKFWYMNLLFGLFMTALIGQCIMRYTIWTFPAFAESLISEKLIVILFMGFLTLGFGVFPLVMLGLSWRHALKSRFEYFAVTNKRVIIIEKIWPIIKFEIPLSSIQTIDDHSLIYPNSVRIVSVLNKRPGFFERFRSFNRQPAPWANYRHKHYQFFLRQLSNTNQIKTIISQSMRTSP